MCLSFCLLNPPYLAFKIQSECSFFLEAFLDPFRQGTVLYHLGLPLHLRSILFSLVLMITVPIVFLLFVCVTSVCLNEIPVTDGQSVVGISIHSHGECERQELVLDLVLGAGSGIGYGILEVAV